MLFNIYVKLLGEVINRSRVKCLHYVDDIYLYLSVTTSAVKVIQILECCQASVLEWTRINKLKPNPDKTEI